MTIGQWVTLAAAAGILLLTLLYRDATFRETIRYSLQGVALMPLFYFAIRFCDNQLFQLLNLPWIAQLGVYSYAIYLVHYVVIKAIATNAPAVAAKPFVVFPVSLLISIGYAAFIDRFVDPYFKRLRSQLRIEASGGTSRRM
jgi:peptidoglycan/LPS O-acetylase OafA/YrhL